MIKTGKLQSIKRFNEWAYATLISDCGMMMKVVGNLVYEMESNRPYEVHLKDQPKRHPVYGDSWEVTNYLPHIAANKEALTKYLVKNFKGIGAVTAKKVTDDYAARGQLDALREHLLSNPFAIDFSAYTSRPVTAQLTEGFNRLLQNKLFLNFGDMKLLNARTFRLLAACLTDIMNKRYDDDLSKAEAPIDEAVREFTLNPYRFIRLVDYYGFKAADEVGLSIGFARNDERRISALAIHVLDEACTGGGHVYVTYPQLEAALARFDPVVKPKEAIEAAVKQDFGLVVVTVKGEKRCYPLGLWEAEEELAMLIAQRIRRKNAPIWTDTAEKLHESIAESCERNNIRLGDEQYQALFRIMTSSCSIHLLTAGPGCGKTRLMELLADIVSKTSRIGFCAPTGKAAKVLTGRVAKFSMQAYTIHTKLKVQKGGGFMYNETLPLPEDIIITDESGMNDLKLSLALLSALRREAHIVFLGDHNQLPSIAPGSVLADMMKMDLDKNNLTVTYRNEGGILNVVQQIRDGRVDMRPYSNVKFHPLPEADLEAIQYVSDIYADALQQYDGDFSKVGLLVARRKGNPNEPGWNVTYLNEALRQRFNAGGLKIKGTAFRIYDRIIIRKNISFLQNQPHLAVAKDAKEKEEIVFVVNGDTGTIMDALYEDEDDASKLTHLLLKLDDDRLIRLPAENLDELGLAYAITVHASQGSEYQHVLFLNVNGAPSFINRGIMFTACSRAQQMLHVFSVPENLSSIARRPIPPRNSALVEKVRENLN